MSPEQFGEVVRLLLIGSLLAGMLGAVIYDLLMRLVHAAIDALQWRAERRAGRHG